MDDCGQWLWHGLIGLPGCCVLIYLILRWLDRPGPARPSRDNSAWVLRYSLRLRLAVVLAAIFFTTFFLAFWHHEFFAGRADNAVNPVVWYLCFAISGGLFLVGLYGCAETQWHKVLLSDHGLTIHQPLGRPTRFAWKDIAEVTYSSAWQIYQVRLHSGAVKRISVYLDGMDLLYQYLDRYLRRFDPQRATQLPPRDAPPRTHPPRP
jgi:hypothetical protein